MTCEQARHLLGAYHDGELTDVVRIQEIEAHLVDCQSCTREMTALQAVSSAIREKAPRFEAPRSLESRIRARTKVKIRQDSAEVKNRISRWFYGPFMFAASCVILLAAVFLRLSPTSSDKFESELVAGHFRSLQAHHLFDVPSSDQHTVKPWFQGKLDFSPNVPDLTQAGFPLLGGRLDYLNHRPAAAIVYGHGRHIINVFVMHRSSFLPGGVDSQDGYHLLKWTAGDLDYWAVSDVNPADLKKFAGKFQSSAGPSR